MGSGEARQWPVNFCHPWAIVLIPHRLFCQFIMPFMCVIAGRVCLLMISMRRETVLYGLRNAMTYARHEGGIDAPPFRRRSVGCVYSNTSRNVVARFRLNGLHGNRRPNVLAPNARASTYQCFMIDGCHTDAIRIGWWWGFDFHTRTLHNLIMADLLFVTYGELVLWTRA